MSGWLWSRSASKQEKDHKQQELQEASILRLRQLLASSEGEIAAEQLVQGGELKDAADLVSDMYLRRWLTARNWEVPHTYTCILKHAAWRVQTMPNGYVDEARIPMLADKKNFVQGVDVLGRAVGITQVRKHFTRLSNPHELMLLTCYNVDALVALCDQTKNPGCRIAAILDLSKCGLANLDFGALKVILDTLTSHYVEVLDVMIMFNPPLVFWGLWNSFKVLLPEATRNKLVMVDPADIKQLQDIVPQEVLPVEYGGKAELIPVDKAVRAFKLPPYHHRPELMARPTACSGADAVAEIASDIDVVQDATSCKAASSGQSKTPADSAVLAAVQA